MNSSVITARVSVETLALVDAVARRRGRSRSWFVVEAIRRATESQSEFDALIDEGLNAIDDGMIIDNEDVMARLDARINVLKAQCSG
jgi:predicted transcriptional regulator